jgi:hypothetical protein
VLNQRGSVHKDERLFFGTSGESCFSPSQEWLACASRFASVRLRSSAAKNVDTAAFLIGLFHVPAIAAILANRNGARDGNDLRLLAKENNEQLPDAEHDPRDDFPPPTDEEPIEQAFFPFLFHLCDGLDRYVFTFALRTFHIHSPAFCS